MKTKDELNELSGIIIDSAMARPREFGSILLEGVHETALARELLNRSIEVKRQVVTSVCYKGAMLDGDACKVDLLVDESILPVHEAQLHTRMRRPHHSLGWLTNFKVPLFKHGIKRHVIQFLQ